MTVVGLNDIRDSLKRQKRRIRLGAIQGLVASQMLVRSVTLPKTPAKDGHLRNSMTTPPPYREGGTTVASISFTAEYAGYVHENMDAMNWNAPGTGPKFLEDALNESHDDILMLLGKDLAV